MARFIDERDRNGRSRGTVALDRVQPVEKPGVLHEHTPLECDVRELPNSRHLARYERWARAGTVLDRLRFGVEPRYLLESKVRADAVYLHDEVELRLRPIGVLPFFGHGSTPE